MNNIWDPSFIDSNLDSRSVSFENPTGARGKGGTECGGRKGAPSRIIAPGERVVLADLKGPGTIRHIWMVFPPAPPELLRSLVLEVFYDGAAEPSISVPALDFFGLPHGRRAEIYNILFSVNEARGYNAFIPIPFRRAVRVEFHNASPQPTLLYYQIDFTIEPSIPEYAGYLHASFRRENPTVHKRDFVIVDNFRGPGRFLGCVVGVRVLDSGMWYGEGEVKIYRDGDRDFPTICGTGLEDYVGSGWGLGRHLGPYGGAPLLVGPAATEGSATTVNPNFVGFYRWHLAEPVMFARELKVTIQQIGAMMFAAGQDAEKTAYEATHPVAGTGWMKPASGAVTWGLVERSDDYCATAFVYCREAQPVPRLDVVLATKDIARLPFEKPDPMEAMLSMLTGLAPAGAAGAAGQT
ncbi:MAG TPA: glycoside hydrolase family 172 protein [Candidatus Binataceae bacterium]|nr:glycoside hydrolase family 172 protein [Candidatus Binataceae bacterium]